MWALKIRCFGLTDLSRILEIEKHSFGLDAFSPEHFIEWHHLSPGLFLVAEKDERVVGYMITGMGIEKAYIVSIAVDPFHRKQGVGRTLASFTFKKLEKWGVTMVELEVRVTNKVGIDFWKSLKFFPVKVVSQAYSDGEAALKMRKLLERTRSEKNDGE